MLLRGAVQVTTHAQLFVWLEKAIEFYVCYVSQSLPDDSGILHEKALADCDNIKTLCFKKVHPFGLRNN